MNFSKGVVFYWRTLYISKMVHFRVVLLVLSNAKMRNPVLEVNSQVQHICVNSESVENVCHFNRV